MTAVETNQLALAEEKFKLPGHTMFRAPDALWGYASRPAGQNVVTGCFFEPDEVRDRVEHILRDYQDAGSHANWFFGPSATPDLAKILRRERRLMGPVYLPAMEMDLSAGPWLEPKSGVYAEMVEDWDALEEEGYPAAEWYPKAARSDVAVFARELNEAGISKYFVAYVDGFVAASCMLFMHHGIAGIYDVVTKPTMRGRGAATAAILAAHSRAIDLGCQRAILQSHKKACGLYERIGYREVGMYISMYYSRPRMKADRTARGA